MTDKEKDDLFYVCSLIEFIGRKTLNKRGTVVNALTQVGIKRHLQNACVNHCLSFEQVSDETIEEYNISNGTFDTITECKYSIPNFLDIGRLYSYMIIDISEMTEEPVIDTLIKIFNSFISDKISDFAPGFYYQSISYLEQSYLEGYLLD